MRRPYLLVLGAGEAIRWVIREERMAFPSTSRREVSALATGDELFLYSTRGAWKNPTRDRGRVIGRAFAASAVQAFNRPLELAGRSFRSGCRIHIDMLAPYPEGIVLSSIIDQLDAFPKSHAWSAYLRRPLYGLPEADAALLMRLLKPQASDRREAEASYFRKISAQT